MIFGNLEESNIGNTVVYAKGKSWEETGLVKSFNNESKTAFVVFQCSDDWENFKNYTGQSTRFADLDLKIDPENCDHDYEDASYKWGNPLRQRCIYCGNIIND